MHARLIRMKGSPEGIDARRARFEEEALPAMREQAGYRGVVALGDPETGEGAVISYWESEEAMTRSGEALAAVRERIFAEQGIEVLAIEGYEITNMERSEPSKVGPSCRIVSGTGSTDVPDEVINPLWEEGKALVRPLSGFCSLVTGVNRSNGSFIVGSSWDTPADRDASEVATADLRTRMVEAIGATSIEVANYELTLAEVPATATATT